MKQVQINNFFNLPKRKIGTVNKKLKIVDLYFKDRMKPAQIAKKLRATTTFVNNSLQKFKKESKKESHYEQLFTP